MEYKPITAVWEITMACNMKCMHCGSACVNALPNELTTDEALNLCDGLGKLEMKWITLSGGEPLTRKDWPQLAKGLVKNGIIPNIITNGWLLEEDTVLEMRKSNVGTVAISIDGLKETHDKIRRKGSYDRSMNAFKLLKKHGQYCGAITSINKSNLTQLDKLKDILIGLGVDSWQLQICIPMGNMVNHKDELLDPKDVDGILDFCLEVAREQKITVYPADCLGYYTEREEQIRYLSLGNSAAGAWNGCNAGKRGFGILHNGDILGCTSIRDRSFIEGNIKERSIVDIWNDEKSFQWTRGMKRSDLGGDCLDCKYADVCLGGCPNTRLTMNGKMESENPYCSYRVAMGDLKSRLHKFEDLEVLSKRAHDYATNGKYQEAAIIIDYLLQKKPDNEELLALQGFVHFFMGNYSKAKEANEIILKSKPKHAYANKGLGLTLHKMGETEKGIKLIRKAIEFASDDFLDPYYDLAAVYNEIGQPEKAREVLSEIEK